MATSKALTANLMASLLLFLIAIPLNLGISLASGLTATQGLVGGVIGGVVVGMLSGCPLMVTGPATGLIAIIWQITDAHGLAALGPVAMAAGGLQIALGMLSLAPWFRAVAPAVIQGMLAGIGILIFASQFHVMLEGVPHKSGLVNLVRIPLEVYNALIGGGTESTHLAGILGALTILLTVLWARIPGRARLIPGSLIGVSVAIGVAWVGRMPVKYVQVPTDLAADLHFITLDGLALLLSPSVLGSVLALAFVATAQTLLTATAVDRLHGGEPTNYDREALAQGVGNMVAGALGVLPMCGVIVRSAANVQAGGTSRASAMLQGLWVGLFTVFFSKFLNLIPISSLAGVLVYTGYRLVDVKALRGLSKFGRGELIICWVTLLGVVTTDVLTGILVGFLVSAARLVYVLSHCRTQIRQEGSRQVVVEIQGSATFFTLPALARSLRRVRTGQEVHVFVSRLNYIDHACLEHLMSWEEKYLERGGEVFIEWDHLMGRFRSPLTREIAEKGAVEQALVGLNAEIPREGYEALVTRSLVLDLTEPLSYQQLVEKVIAELGARLDEASQREARRGLLHELAEQGPPRVGGAALPCHRLSGLSGVEMVLVRCRAPVQLPGGPAGCLVFVFGPEGQTGEYLRQLAALASRLEEANLADWEAAVGASGLKQFLLHRSRFVTLEIQALGPTAELVGMAVSEVAAQALPPGALIALIDREGRALVPKGRTELLGGDRVTILGAPSDIEELRERFGLP